MTLQSAQKLGRLKRELVVKEEASDQGDFWA